MDRYSYEFECTPAQHHANIDKLWNALELDGVQENDCFTLAAEEIVRLRERTRKLESAIEFILGFDDVDDLIRDIASKAIE